MEKTKKLEGIVPPTVTIFDSEGEVDKRKNESFLQHLIDEGVHGLFVSGSTSEAPLMSVKQRKEIIDIGVGVAEGQLPLYAGTGHNSTRITIELSQYAEKAGADAVIVHTPHYPKPTQESMYEHYKAIAKAIGIPVWAYTWPDQYGVSLTPETVARLVKDGYVKGIKDSHLDLDHTAEIIRLTEGEEGFKVFGGEDTLIFPLLCLGGHGSVSVLANIIPAEVAVIFDAFQKGNLEESRKMQLSIMPLVWTLTRRELLKAGINMLGIDVGKALMPTSEISPAEEEKVKQELKKLGKL
jgi:4-hydroxy-tetrahydrodipicolinate synthase